MDVGVCGFGYSGSGAVIDLLKEYNDVCYVFDSEFLFTYFPDGIIDLYHNACEYQSRYYNYDVAAKRFLEFVRKAKKIYGWDKSIQDRIYQISKNFIDEVSLCSYEGYWTYDIANMTSYRLTRYFRFGRRINKVFKREIVRPDSKIYLARDDSFILSARKYIELVLQILGNNTKSNCKINLINQPFAANNPEASFPFFNDPKAIVVKRDPRDVYLMAKHYIKEGANWIPQKSVEKFIAFYKNQYRNLNNRKDVLVISFEDLIYKYGDTVKEIECFLGISGGEKGKYFKPELSVNNTKLFMKISDYQRDVDLIERELKDFLYDFGSVSSLDNSGMCFWD